MDGSTKTVRGLVGVAMSLAMGACELGRVEPGPVESTECGAAVLGPGLRPGWISLEGRADLTVFVDGAERPIAGRMIEGPQGPAFRPAFPLAAGMRYRVRGEQCERIAEVPPAPTPEPEVVAVHPSSPTIPENVLRFYVYFSEPMAEGEFLEHVRLEHVESGEDLSGVFFDNIHELWSSDRRRITLLVDPGRVKTGLRAHRALGRAFEAGQTYRLHVLDTWTSIAGRRLGEGLTHTFRAEPEDRRRVDPSGWRLSRPQPGTTEPLWIDFGEPVDHVSVARFLQVVAADGDALPGRWSLSLDESAAWWVPERAWLGPAEGLALRINGRFEDVAGNNVNAAMDHRVGALRPGDEGRSILLPLPSLPSLPSPAAIRRG